MNSELAKIFRDLAFLLEMKGVDFKPRAFEKAAASIEESPEDLAKLYREGGRAALQTVPGIGAGIAERIEEYIKTGTIAEYEKLKHQLPVNIEDLSSIEGLGPKTILKLYKKLHVTDRAALEASIRSGKFRRKGFGEKTEQNILKNIEFLKLSAGRL
ncbi:MAG TPA: helix-hairpin-helix domain-containing protein, partial [Candidatus Paceibacterota bacterium]|nr:helix-hairpin-helix domain-containing protein [Candidatus Paceibacterota bacterium]